MKTIILVLTALYLLPQICFSSEIRISYSYYKPFIYKKNDGSLTGLDYDILNGFCKASGYKCIFEETSFNSVLQNIWNKKADIAAGAIYKTPSREANGLFSTPYLKTGLVAVVQYDFTGDLKSLYFRTVGVKKNATGHRYALEIQKNFKELNILTFEDTVDSFRALELGYVDWVLNDYYNSLDIVYSKFRGSFKILSLNDRPLFLENSEIAYYLALENKDLKVSLDEYLKTISESGELSKLVDKWFYVTKPISLQDYVKYNVIKAIVLTTIIALIIILLLIYRNQKRLKQDNLFLETLLNIPSAMIFTTNDNFDISFWNSGSQTITGYTKNELKNIDKMLNTKDIIFQEGSSKLEHFVTDISVKSGKKKVLFDIYKISRGKDRYLFFGLDISETLEAINAKIVYEHLYLSIQENAPYGIMIVENENIIINNPLKMWINTDRSFIMQESLPENIKKIIDDFNNTHKEKEILRDIEIFPEKQMDIFINKLVINEKKYLILIFQDNTEKHRTEKLLSEVQKNEAISNIVNSVVHDMNNLLGVISNYASVLKHKYPEDAIAEKISSIAQEFGNYLRSLLNLTKKTEEKKVIYIDNFLESRSDFLRKIAGHDRKFELKIINKGGEIVAIEERFFQLLINLVMNAKDATSSGGSISIIKDFDNNTISIKILDSGTGIPEGYASKIFEPFFTTKGDKGTGLGLYASKIYVEEYGGKIKAYPNYPKGSVFEVTFKIPDRNIT